MDLTREQTSPPKITKINYHFTNQCNYFCHHCYVDKKKAEIPLAQKLRVIDHLKDYFESIKSEGIINLVGGEPTLSPDFEPLLKYIHQKGIHAGIVTNGTAITRDFLEKVGRFIEEIGLSIDSLNSQTNLIIGRCDSAGKSISINEWIEKTKLIRSFGIKLKINICLTRDNCEEDFTAFLKTAQPDRFKIMALSILSGINENVKQKKPTTQQVNQFFERHSAFRPVLENDGDMQNAYAMVNSRGFFCINDRGIEKEIKNLVEFPLLASDLSLIDVEKYFKRYRRNYV